MIHLPRSRRNIGFALSMWMLLVGSIAADPAWAVERIYNILTNESSVAISGSVSTSSGTSPIEEQGPGSLTTTYSGTIRTDRGPTNIQFLQGSSIDANVSGNWQPLADGSAGFAPADYGGRVSFLFGLITANIAARDIASDLTSDVLPLTSVGDFSLDSTTLSLINGSIAFRENLTGESGASSLAGQSGTLSGMGLLSVESLVETLTIPINASFVVPIDESTTANFALDGQLVATAMLPAGLPGDYNENGTVDAADYVVWRDTLGSTSSLPNDDTPGVDADDYTRWRAHFGKTAGIGTGSGATGSTRLSSPKSASAQAVPEPASIAIFLAVAISAVTFRRPSLP